MIWWVVGAAGSLLLALLPNLGLWKWLAKKLNNSSEIDFSYRYTIGCVLMVVIYLLIALLSAAFIGSLVVIKSMR